MAIKRNDISDPAFELEIFHHLQDFGFSPERRGDIIQLSGVGAGLGDDSVDLTLNLVEMDGHRILEISSQVKTPAVSFDKAVITAKLSHKLTTRTGLFRRKEPTPMSVAKCEEVDALPPFPAIKTVFSEI